MEKSKLLNDETILDNLIENIRNNTYNWYVFIGITEAVNILSTIKN